MSLNFFVTDQLAQINGVRCLIFGGPGAGKTRILGTAPSPFILSCENGLLSLRDKHIPGLRIENYAELEEAVTWILTAREMAHIRTICFDSGSDIAETVLKKNKDNYKDGRQAYGDMGSDILSLFKTLRNIPGKNVVITAKLSNEKDALTGIMQYRPAFPGQMLGANVPYLFDEVFYLGAAMGQDGKPFPYLQTFNDGRTYAKDRSGALQSYEKPDLSYIFAKITGAPKNASN